jgi:hypothetical protein
MTRLFAWLHRAGRLRLIGVAVLVAASILVGGAANGLAIGPNEPGASIAEVSPATPAALVALPGAQGAPRLVPQPRLPSTALLFVLAAVCWLGARSVSRAYWNQPPRFAHGRRGRALLQAYLN